MMWKETIYHKKDIKIIEQAMLRHQDGFLKLLKKICLCIAVGMSLLLFLVFANDATNEQRFLHELESFYLILIPIFGSYPLVLGILKLFVIRKPKVCDIIRIECYIKKHSISRVMPRAGYITTDYYYVDVIRSGKLLQTLAINESQHQAIAILYSQDPDRLFNLDVAVLAPRKVDLLDAFTKNGTLLLLPVEHYIDSDFKLIKTQEHTYLAPLQLGRQPQFSLAREEIEQTKDVSFLGEEPLYPAMSNLKFDHFDEITLESKDSVSGDKLINHDNISDVTMYASDAFDDFLDVRTRSKPKKDRKGPNFIAYCALAYFLNYLLVSGISIWPNLSFIINILITTLITCTFLFINFFPLQVKLPVRFNRKAKEIYVNTQQGLYKIPWHQSDFSVVAKQYKNKTIYELKLWLPGQFNMTKTLYEPHSVTLYSAENVHGKVYFYWDYINRYMKFDRYFDEQNKLIEEFKEEKENESLESNIFYSLLSILLIPLLIPMFLSDPNQLRFLCNPFKVKWPKVVHDWTGKVHHWY